jgi:hypothetical protein
MIGGEGGTRTYNQITHIFDSFVIHFYSFVIHIFRHFMDNLLDKYLQFVYNLYIGYRPEAVNQSRHLVRSTHWVGKKISKSKDAIATHTWRCFSIYLYFQFKE